MSIYWGYYCRDCEVASEDHWINHGERALAEYKKAREALADFDFYWIEVAPLGYGWAAGEMAEFLDKHRGHDVALQDEYGNVKDLPAVQVMVRHEMENNEPILQRYKLFKGDRYEMLLLLGPDLETVTNSPPCALPTKIDPTVVAVYTPTGRGPFQGPNGESGEWWEYEYEGVRIQG